MKRRIYKGRKSMTVVKHELNTDKNQNAMHILSNKGVNLRQT